jgi:hypothetical protein
MKRLLIASAALALGAVAVPSIALAVDDNQPSEGENSTGRNDEGFGGGPHCHVLRSSHGAPFEWIRVFPSHQGHASSGTADGPFLADPDCDGDPG